MGRGQSFARGLGAGLSQFGNTLLAFSFRDQERKDRKAEQDADRDARAAEQSAREAFQMHLMTLQDTKARNRQIEDRALGDMKAAEGRARTQKALDEMPEGPGKRRASAEFAGVQGVDDADFMTAEERAAANNARLQDIEDESYRRETGARRAGRGTGTTPVTPPGARGDVPPDLRQEIAAMWDEGMTREEIEADVSGRMPELSRKYPTFNPAALTKHLDGLYGEPPPTSGAFGGASSRFTPPRRTRHGADMSTPSPEGPPGLQGPNFRQDIHLGGPGRGPTNERRPGGPQGSALPVTPAAPPMPSMLRRPGPSAPPTSSPSAAPAGGGGAFSDIEALVAEFEREMDPDRKALLKAEAEKRIAKIRAAQGGGR